MAVVTSLIDYANRRMEADLASPWRKQKTPCPSKERHWAFFESLLGDPDRGMAAFQGSVIGNHVASCKRCCKRHMAWAFEQGQRMCALKHQPATTPTQQTKWFAHQWTRFHRRGESRE